MSKDQRRIEYCKLKKGDKILLWATVKEVHRTYPSAGANDVTIAVENYHNPSMMDVELALCDIQQIVHKADVLSKVRKFIEEKLKLSGKEQEIVDSLC